MKTDTKSLNFIEQIIENDLNDGYSKDELRFRFPPEPNGYLHIGHVKAICISFGLGLKYNAPVNLRFDDTNPAKESQEYVDAIKKDVAWLGYEWDQECYSSDYFDQLHAWAIDLIKQGKAYVDSQSSEAMAEQKGTPTEPGIAGPYRDRSIEENLQLFNEMREGKHAEGTHVLRAKIDMSHTNMLMRDPLMYRIIHKHHQRSGDAWCIYPMYDWTHGESDYIENISHSLCSLEFKPHRELYEWFLDNISTTHRHPKQREFARLNLNYTVMSKRKLLQLVEDGIVTGWDDPRMPTISGLRRRGYTPASLRNFVDTVGVAKRENIIEFSLLEYCIREDLNKIATRVMAVLDPVKLVITNYPSDKVEYLELENNPEQENSGTHLVPFSRELFIERDDFKEEANSKYFRLTLGKEVRLKGAYIIKGESVVKDDQGNIIEIHCTYDPDSKSGSGTEASLKKVKGTLHWVSIEQAINAEVRVYDRLFTDEAPDSHAEKSFMDFLNTNSLKTVNAFVEPYLQEAKQGDYFQFTRLGYFTLDLDSTSDALVFNKTVGLKDSWSKKKPVSKDNSTQKTVNNNQPKKSAFAEIQKLGKKYTNLPEAKQQATKEKIIALASEVSYEELSGLFGTAKKKVGTRIAAILILSQYLKSNTLTPEAESFINEAKSDTNELLVFEASQINL